MEWFWHVVMKIIWILELFHLWNNIEHLKWWDHALVKIFYFRYHGRLGSVLVIMLIGVCQKKKCRFMPDFGLLIYVFSSGYRALLLLLRYLIDSNGRTNIEKLQYL